MKREPITLVTTRALCGLAGAPNAEPKHAARSALSLGRSTRA